jgi:hypothetical protein
MERLIFGWISSVRISVRNSLLRSCGSVARRNIHWRSRRRSAWILLATAGRRWWHRGATRGRTIMMMVMRVVPHVVSHAMRRRRRWGLSIVGRSGGHSRWIGISAMILLPRRWHRPIVGDTRHLSFLCSSRRRRAHRTRLGHFVALALLLLLDLHCTDSLVLCSLG